MPEQRGPSRSAVVGFLVAAVLLVALVAFVGPGAVVAAILSADVGALGFLSVVTVCWIVAWSGSLHLVFRVFDVHISALRTVGVYTTMMFWDNVTPLSTFSADPVAAWSVSRAAGVEYDTSLAVVVSVDTLNFVPAPALSVLGLVYLTVTASLGETFQSVAVSLAALLALLGGGGAVAWRYRRAIGSAIADVAERALALGGRLLGEERLVDSETVRTGIWTVLDDLELVAERPRDIAFVLAFATVGWVFLSLTLWVSLLSVGAVVSVGVVLALVPLVTVTEAVPLPGGVGGLEPVLVLLLVAVTTVSPATATAGVLVFRGATFWFPVAVGGGAVSLLGAE
jgi:hypothetical protein